MDEFKHLQPHFSYAVKDLAIHYNIFEKLPASNSRGKAFSTTSSNSFDQLRINTPGFSDSDSAITENNVTIPAKRPTPDLRKQLQGKNKRTKTVSPYLHQTQKRVQTGGTISNKEKLLNQSVQHPTIHNNNIIITINKSFNVTPNSKSNKSNAYIPKNNTRKISPMHNSRGKLSLKYATQRINNPDIQKQLKMPKTTHADEQELLKRVDDYPENSANYSDLEIIKEDQNIGRNSVACSRKSKNLTNVYHTKKFQPYARRPKFGYH